jgi:YolD-like protein
MPEHVKLQRDFYKDYYNEPRPQLNEGQIEDMERILSESLQHKTLLEITTWKNGFFTKRVRTVTKIDPYDKKIIIQDESDSIINIDFYSITNFMII